MSEPIDNTDNSSPMSDRDETVLKLLVGDKTCAGGFMKILWYIIEPILLTVLFAIVLYLRGRDFVGGLTDSKKVSTVMYLAIFFVGALLIDILMESWKNNNPICEGK